MAGPERVTVGRDAPRVIELYDMACRARILGAVEEPQLREFADGFIEPRLAACSPEEPPDRSVNEYTLWLVVRGVENCHIIAKRPRQPLVFSEALEMYSRLSRDFGLCTAEESVNILDSLQDFFALVLRYPIVPQLVMDTKECPECYFETDINLDTWEDTKKKLVCHHFTLRHETFPPERVPDAQGLSRITIDDSFEMVRAGPCDSMFLTSLYDSDDASTATGLKPIKFLEHLESIKRLDEIFKQKTLGRELFHQYRLHKQILEEIEAPRYLSSHPIRCLYQFYGSLNRSRERARRLSQPYPEVEADGERARSSVENLKVNLVSAASTGTNEALLSYVCMATVDPVRRYKRQFNAGVERVVLFKHLIASGFPVETAWNVVKSVRVCNRVAMLAVTLEEGVRLQLKKTARPTVYNRKIASLIWLFSHITAYCTLRQLNRDHVQMADAPRGLDEDGIYVFDRERVGFRLSRTTGPPGGTGASACVPFAQILELLAMRDGVQERFR